MSLFYDSLRMNVNADTNAQVRRMSRRVLVVLNVAHAEYTARQQLHDWREQERDRDMRGDAA